VSGRDRPVRSTYRVQLHPGFTFADAQALVPQLRDLGISHLYLSPSLEAVPGSTHGYDVIDPTRIREVLGGEAGLRELADAAHQAGLGLVLDIVPNHVGLVSPANPWWWDVLAHGPDGRYGNHLDVHWQPGRYGQQTLLLPELGAPLEDELQGDALRLDHEDAGDQGHADRSGWRIVYHDHVWPVAPGSIADAGLDEDDVPATLAAVGEDRTRLADVLDRQHYRLAYWRRANDELDHRRFFDISTLGAVRIEDPVVFDDVHAAVLPLLHDGTLDGLRIDHTDGLADPVGYFHRLREAAGDDAWIVIEKILEAGENFRHDWPVDGTVGYEFADRVLGLHVARAAGEVFDDLQATLTGSPIDRDALVDDAKRSSLRTLFGAERHRLALALVAASPDIGPDDADEVLTELIVAWPVYRTYVRPEDDEVLDADRAVIDHAVARVRARRPDLGAMLDRVAALLRLEHRSAAADVFVGAFQQLTGPAVAKGLEDTVLYRDTRFVAVNEVGGDPAHLGRHVGELHAGNADVQVHRPATMLLSSTHDTKRSEDVRARLAVCSQDLDGWVRTVLSLRELGAAHVGRHGPTPAHQHLAIQTAVGAWPIDRDRLGDYLVKAAREGKEVTNWLDPDEAYEAELVAYGDALVNDPTLRAAVERAVEAIREPGWLTSLSMTLLKLASPGVPDIYQGCELWDLSLVDPDNRRPVDHHHRAALLKELEDGIEPGALLARLDEGLPKLALTRAALRLRAQRPEAFGPDADYRALWPSGARAGHLAAFVRGDTIIALAPVQVRALGATHASWAWADTSITLPAGTWRDVVTGTEVAGGTHRIDELLASFPVGLLERTSGRAGA
jgi:(1->4)-alpha-D-glucan 1-alpha-D-glucosylmutase